MENQKIIQLGSNFVINKINQIKVIEKTSK